jgi:hypothetical protein
MPQALEDVPIALALWVGDRWCDIQHLLWDLMEFTTRARAILDDGDTGLADAMKDFFGHQRDQLTAFKEMMLTGDPDAEKRWLGLSGMDDEYPHTEWEPIPGLPPMIAPGHSGLAPARVSEPSAL